MKVYYLPYGSYEIKVNLNKQEVLKRIYSDISTHSRFKDVFNNDRKYFRGSIDKDSFEIRKKINNRNSWNPILKGKLIEVSGKSIINVKIRLHPLVQVFSIIWIIFVLIIGLIPFSLEQFLFSLGMIAFLYIMTFIFFNIGAEQATDALEEILKKPLHNN